MTNQQTAVEWYSEWKTCRHCDGGKKEGFCWRCWNTGGCYVGRLRTLTDQSAEEGTDAK